MHQDTHCERDVIATLLDDPKLWSAYGNLLTADSFCDPAAGELYRAMSEVAAHGLHPSRRELAKRYLRGEVGEALEQVWQNHVPDPDALPGRVTRLNRLHNLRESVTGVHRAHMLLGHDNTTSDEALQHIEKLHRHLGEHLAPRQMNRVIGPQQWVDEGLAEAERRRKLAADGKAQYLNLGFPSLSKYLALQPEGLMLLAADSGKGKTNVALNMAASVGVKQSIPSLYINAEMSEHELKFRLLGILAGVPAAKLRTGLVGAAEIQQATQTMHQYREQNKLHITPSWDSMALSDIITATRQHHTEHGIQVLFVDYLQRLGDYMDANDRDWKELWRVAKTLKSLAQELKLIAIVVVQATAEGTLAGSQGMKRDADAVCLLKQTEPKHGGLPGLRLEILKNRHGPDSFGLSLHWDRETLQIHEESGHDYTG